MADGTDTPVWTCAQCSAEFTGRKRKFCSDDCRRTAQHRKRYPRAWSEYVRDAQASPVLRRVCPECHQRFKPTRGDGHSKGPQIHCSVACSKAQAARDRQFRQEQASLHRLLTEVRWGPVSRVKQCGCGKFMQPTHYLRQCDECRQRNKLQARRKSRRIRKGIERARLRSAMIERVDPIEVFNRDGWRCHMCGIKTPKRLRGTYQHNAPELDHIIPLAAGGEHSMRNTACSCRKCNGEKGAKPMGQLRLVA